MSDKKVGNFDILKAMAHENQDIRFAPIGDNFVSAQYSKKGTQVTIGFPGNICFELSAGKLGGGLLLYDIKQYISTKKRLEKATETKKVCLCGSTRFTEQMMIKSWELAKQGIIALGWNVLPDSYVPVPSRCALGGEYADRKDALHIESHGAEAEGLKEQIDELHKRKIDLCDEVFVLNIGGYIGDSTRSEIAYTVEHGKPVEYMEPIEKSDDPT